MKYQALRIIFGAIAALIALASPAQRRLIDAVTSDPLPSAAITDRNGNMFALTDREGNIPDIPADRLPVTFSYSGYAPLEVSSVGDGDIAMTVRLYELDEVVVQPGDHPLMHIKAYVRSITTTTGATDSMTIFKESIVDYLRPVGKSKVKGWNKPRTLASRTYMRHTDSSGLDSVSDKVDELLLFEDLFARFPDISGLSKRINNNTGIAGSDTVMGKYYPRLILNRTGDYVRAFSDNLADEKDHTMSPWLAKALGMTMDVHEANCSLLLDVADDMPLGISSINSFSYSMDVMCRGKLFKSLFRTSGPVKLTTYSEVYVIDREYLTDEDARDLKENAPKVKQSEIAAPEGVPEPHPAIIGIVKRVDDLRR